MNYVLLDGTEFKDVSATHAVLKEKLELPDYYGENLDALWDCLTGWIELPLQIKWINYSSSFIYLGEYAEKLKCTFQDAASEFENFSLTITD